MTTHVYGSRWIDCMRGAEGCQSDAEHDLRNDVANLRRALDDALSFAHIPMCSCYVHGIADAACEANIKRIREIAEGGWT